MKLATLVLIAVCLTGCFEKKPVIPGFHWKGDTLYNEQGEEAADIVGFPWFMFLSSPAVPPHSLALPTTTIESLK